jgi:hypothetical protein
MMLGGTWDDVLLEDGIDEAGVLHDTLHVLGPATQLVLEPSHDERLHSGAVTTAAASTKACQGVAATASAAAAFVWAVSSCRSSHVLWCRCWRCSFASCCLVNADEAAACGAV